MEWFDLTRSEQGLDYRWVVGQFGRQRHQHLGRSSIYVGTSNRQRREHAAQARKAGLVDATNHLQITERRHGSIARLIRWDETEIVIRFRATFTGDAVAVEPVDNGRDDLGRHLDQREQAGQLLKKD